MHCAWTLDKIMNLCLHINSLKYLSGLWRPNLESAIKMGWVKYGKVLRLEILTFALPIKLLGSVFKKMVTELKHNSGVKIGALNGIRGLLFYFEQMVAVDMQRFTKIYKAIIYY